MQATKFLVTVLLVVFFSQNVQLKELPRDNATFDVFVDNSNSQEIVTKLSKDKLNIKDVWNNVKKSIVNAWNSLKKLANNSKHKINKWMENVKARAQDIIKSFEKRMNHLKDEIHEIIKHIFDETQIVKGCLKEEQRTIDNIIKTFIQDLTLCISRNLKNITLLNVDIISLNDTHFYEGLESKYKVCEQDVDNAEECLNEVRKDYYKDIEQKETDVYEYRAKSRKLADELLDSLVSCSIDIVIEASPIILSETLNIVRCIVKSPKE